MKKSKRGKLSESVLAAIIIAAVAALLFVAAYILNLFIPLRYFSAYTVSAEYNEAGVMRVTFIDVGFGESILAELPDGKNLLIDGGDGSYPNQLSLLTTLNGRGVDRIDYLVCSSVKKEHCGGLAEILKYKEVGTVYMPYCNNTRITDEYRAFYLALEDSGAEQKIACVGEGASGEDYFFTFLSPSNYKNPLSEYAELNSEPDKESKDNASAIVWLECGGTSFAFTSDARSGAFERLIADYNLKQTLGEEYCPFMDSSVDLTSCDVITVSGHGGEDNAYAPLYELLTPAQAVVSVGKNYDDYPSAIALSNPCGVRADVYLTEESGNITFTVKDGEYSVEEENK